MRRLSGCRGTGWCEETSKGSLLVNPVDPAEYERLRQTVMGNRTAQGFVVRHCPGRWGAGRRVYVLSGHVVGGQAGLWVEKRLGKRLER